MVPIQAQRVYAQAKSVEPTATDETLVTSTAVGGSPQPETTLVPTTIDGAGMWGYAAVWCVVIVGITELLKRLWLARSQRKSLVYRRAVPLFPLVVGIVSAPMFAPDVLEALGYILESTTLVTPLGEVELHLSALWFGAPAGMAASWIYVLLRKVIWPMLPGVTRAFVRTGLQSFGVSVQSSDELPTTLGGEETEDLL